MKRSAKRFAPAGACLLLILSTALAAAYQDGELSLDPAMHHFGNDETPEWPEAPSSPEGSSLSFEFEAQANDREWTLVFTQRHISNNWWVTLNGKRVATCRVGEPLVECHFPVPAGTLVDGANRFELNTDSPADDITFGRIKLIEAPFREVFQLAPVLLGVRESGTLNPIPARVTITDQAGNLVPVYYAEELHQATREGVVYTDNGNLHFEVPAGTYRVLASRGPEWSIASADITVAAPEPESLGGLTPPDATLVLTHEVDTTGFVACDTHIHTLTFSGHGDSSVEERMVTLAGEGVELAISTDHNHNTDYAPYQERMGLGEFFTTAVGNEVSTPIGHFNAFPLDPNDEVPLHNSESVVKIVESIRAHGAEVVILNHPRWPNHENSPFGLIELDHFTGQGNGTNYATFPMDALELINSCTVEPDPQLLFADWFSLLNAGEKLSAVASSDSHTVGKPVGGGRTYVPSATEDVSSIDVRGSARAIAEGRTSLSMGIYLETHVVYGAENQEARMGDLAAIKGKTCEMHLRVQAPSWIHPREARLYSNGEVIRSIPLDSAAGEPTDLRFQFKIEEQHAAQDAWVVWVVTGDGVPGNHWPLHNDYTLGATNPIFLDWSRDGVYQSPLESARRLYEYHGAAGSVSALHWEAVNYFAMELGKASLFDELKRALEKQANKAGMNKAKFAEYLKTVRLK